MPNGGSGVCGNCANEMLRGGRRAYIGYCRVHRVVIERPYWTTCKDLIRWEHPREAWEEEKARLGAYLCEQATKILPIGQASPEAIREYHYGFARQRIHPETNAHLSMYAAGPQSDGVLYSTDTCQPLGDMPAVEALEDDPRKRDNAAAIRASIEILQLETDAQALLRCIEALASGKGPFDLLVAANEIRHLVRRRTDERVIAQAFQSVLAALDDEDRFRYYHDPFDTVCRTLYLSWGEFSPNHSLPLPEVPDWPALLANEALRSRYHELYAPDVLQPSVGADPSEDFLVTYKRGTPEPEIRRIERERQQNGLRRTRLRAIFEFDALRSVWSAPEQTAEGGAQ